MIDDREKIVQFIEEAEKNFPKFPKIVHDKSFFERWEQDYEPRAFPISGSTLSLGVHELQISPKDKYIVYMRWNPDSGSPVLMVENKKRCYAFPVDIQNGNVIFSEPSLAIQAEDKENVRGEEIEVVYDAIDCLVTEKPEIDILNIKKKTFVQTFDQLKEYYDKALLNRMSKFSTRQIKQLIDQAASDMASDELSPQLAIPFDGSYASIQSPDGTSNKPQRFVIASKTRWEILQEIELLMDMAESNYEALKTMSIPLTDAKVMDSVHPSRTIIQIPVIKNLPLNEGTRFTVHKKGSKESHGTFWLNLFDYDAIYGSLQLDAVEDIAYLNDFYLCPQKPPHKMQMIKIRELADRLRQHPETIQGALRAILGMDSMTFRVQPDSKGDAEMDFSQRQAFGAAVHPENTFVGVQGPPGTGKTWVLIHIIRNLCMQGKRIVITAPSNTAVDNIVRRITDLPVMRFGNPDKLHPEVFDTCWYGNSDNVDQFIKKLKKGKLGSIYAATHVRMLIDDIIAKDYQQRGLFDVIIFDEAGMSRMDEFLLCSQFGKRVIIFGDHKQLPPFPLTQDVQKKLDRAHPNTPERIRGIITWSALEWLEYNRNFPLIMLKRSYRCQNPRLLRFSSTLFYDALVKTDNYAEYFRLSYFERKKRYPKSTLGFYRTSHIPDELRQEVIVFENDRIGIENPGEALICRKVFFQVMKRYQFGQITVITPYKRQATLIRKLMSYEIVKNHLSSKITSELWKAFLDSRIATVDSFQGEESEVVIISYVRSNIGKGIGFVDNPNRINVAHTRCRREMIIIGDLECLKQQERADIFKRMERTFRRDGEIIDVDMSFFN